MNKMGNKGISDSIALKLKILLLKEEKTAQEAGLNEIFKELTQPIFKPVYALKEERYEQRDRKREFIDLTKLVLNMGTDYIIEQSFGKHQKFKDFLASIMVELVSTPLINRNITKLFYGINNRLFGKKEVIG